MTQEQPALLTLNTYSPTASRLATPSAVVGNVTTAVCTHKQVCVAAMCQCSVVYYHVPGRPHHWSPKCQAAFGNMTVECIQYDTV